MLCESLIIYAKQKKKILAYMPTLVELIGENPLEEME